jgi:hypothetical protein
MAIRIQNHIHLDFIQNGSPENAPSDTFVATQMSPQFQVFASFKRSLSAKPHLHVHTDDSGNPKVFEDYVFEIRLRSEVDGESLDTYNALREKLWQGVYFVPHLHPDDGENHATYVRSMVLTEVGPIQLIDPKLRNFSFKLVLQDFSKSGYGTGSTLSGIESAS